jgi:hypothetical protein
VTPKQLSQLRKAPAYHREVGGDLPLDPWIGFAVKVLRDAGIETIESCQGGPGHCYAEPTVRFGGTSTAGFRAFNTAMEHGLPVRSLQRSWTVEDGELTGPHWYIVFHPLWKLKKRQLEAERAGMLGALSEESPPRNHSA